MRSRVPEFPDVLAAAALTRERVLPVAESLVPLLPEGGLVRGQTVAARGVAAMSLALALTVKATAAGSWLAIVDVPMLGLEAAEEFGIPLERVVRIDPGTRAAGGETWAELMAAVVDGFEIVVTRVPANLNVARARRVQARLQAREAVVIALGSPGLMATAVELRASQPRWEGVEAGAGYLRGRRVTVTSEGRRVPRPRRAELWLPNHEGTVAAIAETVEAPAVPSLDHTALAG